MTRRSREAAFDLLQRFASPRLAESVASLRDDNNAIVNRRWCWNGSENAA
jgi:hypothetical protein